MIYFVILIFLVFINANDCPECPEDIQTYSHEYDDFDFEVNYKKCDSLFFIESIEETSGNFTYNSNYSLWLTQYNIYKFLSVMRDSVVNDSIYNFKLYMPSCVYYNIDNGVAGIYPCDSISCCSIEASLFIDCEAPSFKSLISNGFESCSITIIGQTTNPEDTLNCFYPCRIYEGKR